MVKNNIVNCLLFVFGLIISIKAEKLQVYDQLGKQYEMAYEAPDIFKPIPHSEIQEPPGDIGPINLRATAKILTPIQSDIVKVASTFFKRNEEPIIHRAQYVYYNTKYNLDKERAEIPICVVSPFYNFFSSKSRQMYLDTLENQNYTNFHVVMTDDVSTDNSTIGILKLVEEKYPRLSRRLTILRTKNFIGMLGNHDIEIRNFCREGELVVEVDGDDSLIGRQVMKLLNAYYTDHPESWIVYANMLLNPGKHERKFSNRQIPKRVYETNSYRTSGMWITSHLKSYYRAVYMKIPPDYFWRAPGLYHYHAADIFNIVAIIELSGREHTHYLNQLLYSYRFSGGCSGSINLVAQKISRMKTPFLPLKDLNDTAHLTPDYETPQKIIAQYNRAVVSGYKCLIKFREKIGDPTYMTKIDL